jgi:hypothetical protein
MESQAQSKPGCLTWTESLPISNLPGAEDSDDDDVEWCMTQATWSRLHADECWCMMMHNDDLGDDAWWSRWWCLMTTHGWSWCAYAAVDDQDEDEDEDAGDDGDMMMIWYIYDDDMDEIWYDDDDDDMVVRWWWWAFSSQSATWLTLRPGSSVSGPQCWVNYLSYKVAADPNWHPPIFCSTHIRSCPFAPWLVPWPTQVLVHFSPFFFVCFGVMLYEWPKHWTQNV